MPDLVAPMQVVPGELPHGAEWAVEFAWAGLRCLAYVLPNRLRLLTAASDRDVTASFPELVAPLTAVAPARGVIVDGTVVALRDGGLPRRRLLQARSATARPTEALMKRTPVGFLVGDLLWLAGQSAVELPYRRRRELLARLRLDEPPVAVSPSFPVADVDAVLRAAEQHGVEALHARHLEAPYRPGRRSRTWLRVPTTRTRQVVIGGWTPAGPRRPDSVAALLLGVPAGNRLEYVGRVGLGSASAHRRLAAQLVRLRRPASPFRGPLPAAVQRDGQWVDPSVVGLVEFAGWTADGRLRLPLWRGCVDDEGAEPRPWAQPPGADREDPERAEEGTAPEAGVRKPAVPGDPAPAHAPPAAGPAAPAGPAAAEPGPSVQQQRDEARGDPDAVASRRLEQHFIYNSLNTIASLVRTDPARARELLLGFADLARATDRAGAAGRRLGDELAAVRAYLALEQARFGARLRIDVEVDPALQALHVAPSAVLVAVREAVQQRIEPRPEGGTLTVRAGRSPDGATTVRVTDGGGDPILIGLAEP